MEMRNRGALNKKSGTLMSFGVVHDKYTKGIDITQVCIKSLLLCSQGQKDIKNSLKKVCLHFGLHILHF